MIDAFRTETSIQTEFQLSARRAIAHGERELEKRCETLTSELRELRAAEQMMLQRRHDLSLRHATLAQEFEHRLMNSLQLIASLLSLQSRDAATPEVATQLAIASRRVDAVGRVHRQLHLLDHLEKVEFQKYLRDLCGDLSDLLFPKAGNVIVVEGEIAEIPTALAIPLGLIVNELITNAAKYSKGSIIVRFETRRSASYSLIVRDCGPGLPSGFVPGRGKGLGMKIVQALVQQIGGELSFSSGDKGCGATFVVTFPLKEQQEGQERS